MNRTLRIGTRGSELALWQAHHVASLLTRLDGAAGNLSVQIVEIRTEGDHVLDRPLSEVPGKAFFTKEIEEALAAGHVDLAVHSLKDLPTELPPGLALAAVLEREDPRDVWIAAGGVEGRGFTALPAGGRVGTSSLRRRALLARYRPDLSFVAFQGQTLTGCVRLWDIEVGQTPLLFLGPLAVESGARNAGTGQALVNRACEVAKAAGAAAVLLVGDPPYFSRMGFVAAGNAVVLPGPVDQRRVLVRWLGEAGALAGPLTGP